ncbi:heterokaryon incompatibility protein-domain-containing protein [Parachaetomium inaequale]|uniref:Heterokaryon incompatibility protein-domain-containing protein n=1 Tax=Parachaetomium inaequale TaxID=2588326 RepID=A0AAN6PIG2_9PEZI|nr:heterokaryon incompatibility protein-domain-containing protein [Parachaetomium inaequale]
MATFEQPVSAFSQGDPRSLFRVRSSGLCAVCYNLDPYQAPPDLHWNQDRDKAAWAQYEYKLAPGTPVAKIEISDAAELRASAERGCVFCSMVATALGGAVPGWEKEESYLYLFLAPGLPLVVRLHFGRMSSRAAGPEDMLALGVVVPEGKKVSWVVETQRPSDDESRQTQEFEIYRRSVDREKTTVGDLIQGELIRHLGTASPSARHSGSIQCFRFMQSHIQACVLGHPECSPNGHHPVLPDRVLWVNAPQTQSGIRLVETQGTNLRAPYLALSYCWGPVSPSTFLTDASNLAERKAGIAHHNLPPLFQDVVHIARTLGIYYVWIDRLCIVQGSRTDFAQQAPKMGAIYGNAGLTIAAASANSENDHILVERDPKWATYELSLGAGGMGKLHCQVRRRPQPLGKEEQGGDYGRISTRAWCWQERMLSSRAIFFTQASLKFECRTHSVWEGFDNTNNTNNTGSGGGVPAVVGPSWSAQLDRVTHHTWMGLVEEYTARAITRASDRLPAIEAVMRRVAAAQHGWTPLWGMWGGAGAPVESLAWMAESRPRGRGRGAGEEEGYQCRLQGPGFYAPSWSWASLEGPISYLGAKFGAEPYDPYVAAMEVRKWDTTEGVITVEGRVSTFEVRCEVPAEGLSDDAEPGKESVFYDYALGATGLHIKADVPLKPWTRVVDGKTITSAVRVPHGEPWPDKPWTGNCLCLVLFRQKLRFEALVLGQSARVPGAWERIGMVGGINPDGFLANSEAAVVEIA